MLFRVFQENISDQIGIEKENFNYLTKTLRLKVGNKFEIINGTTTIFVFEIKEISKNRLTAQKTETYQENNEPEKKLILIQGLPKNEKIELVLQKCTELGIFKFIFFQADKSIVKIKNKNTKLERWNKIIESAVCQSRRTIKPALEIYESLEKTLANMQSNLFFADQKSNGKPIENIQEKKLSFCIGPEAGFSEKEKLLLNNIGQPILLGKTTLRTETSAIAACAKILL